MTIIAEPTSPNIDSTLHYEFDRCYAEYCHNDFSADNIFDLYVISDVSSGLKRGKAVGSDGISAELLHSSHPVWSSICSYVYSICLLSMVMFRTVSAQVIPYLCSKERTF
jgi:hypothetical protein